MSIIEDWLPPSRENWQTICTIFQFFPVITIAQWIISIYPAGKTSIQSQFNIPGKVAWITMEVPGFMILLYIMVTLPTKLGIESIPWQNKLLAGLFTIHYINRAIIGPLLNPSMSPIHVLVWAGAVLFQFFNAMSIGGWLAGHGPISQNDWSNQNDGYDTRLRVIFGVIVFFFGLIVNTYHDEELRRIRKESLRKQQKKAARARQSASKGKKTDKSHSVDKVYEIPQNGFFRWILHPHYFFEWIEWIGFWIVGGASFVPARTFVVNEITTMLPRAVQGKNWYIKTFGKDNIGNRKAVIPGLI